ncbi:MAG: hypothetical protein VKJ05_03080 [Synechococcaceae cyanobacterium]|nr:hypothetical protein [Synechococcaceae cyanobacterium]
MGAPDERSTSPPPGRCVVVLGMHRSGTSVLMGTLRDAGVHIGQVLGSSIEGNPKGLQEAPSVLYMQENLLESSGGSWSAPPDQVVWRELHRSVRDLFIESRAALPLWGFKDPRTLLTLEGWLEVLPQLEPVGIFRHPLPVARSLQRRNGFPIEQGVALWLAYNRRLLAWQRQRPFPLIEFDPDPARVRQGLAAVVAALDLPQRRQAEEASFFTPQRNPAAPPEAALEGEAAAIYAELQQIAASWQAQQRRAPDPSPEPAPEAGLTVLSTRLFPKYGGAEAYALSGIAARCDWVVLSDEQEPQVVLRRRVERQTPRHVFLSLRQPYAALAFFEAEVLPRIRGPFRLVSGSEDVTLPRQLDKRWRPFTPEERKRIVRILHDPRLTAWAAENLDAGIHPKLMPLPVGLTFPEGGAERPLPIPRIPPQGCRPLRLLCAHRVREGPQWEPRRQVLEMARRELAAWTTLLEEEVPERRFIQLLRQHAFVLCVAGGGLDPSPKAWLAMLHGTIPVVQSSALDGAYRDLPVAFVDEWSAEALQPQQLAAWQRSLIAAIDTPEGRRRTLERLSLEHWWERILQFGG